MGARDLASQRAGQPRVRELNESQVSLKPLTLARRGTRWTGRMGPRPMPPVRSRRSPRAWLSRRRGLVLRFPGPLTMVARIRRARTTRTAIHVHGPVRWLQAPLSRADHRLQRRHVKNLNIGRDRQAAARQALPAALSARDPAVVAPAAMASRSRGMVGLHRRIDKLERHVDRVLAGPRGASGSPGRDARDAEPPPATSPPSARPGPASPWLEPTRAGETSAAEQQPKPSAAGGQPSGSTADIDEIATQVLRRIERRAIAQRERMGRF